MDNISLHQTIVRVVFALGTAGTLLAVLRFEVFEFLGIPRRARHNIVKYLSLVSFTTALVLLRPHVASLPLGEKIAISAALAAGGYFLITRPWFAQKYIPAATASRLGFVRIVVCAALLLMAIKDDLQSTLILPADFIRHTTLISPFLDVFPQITDVRNPLFLAIVQFGTIAFLATGLLGLFTRFSLLLAAIGYTIFYHTQILYTHFYHSGLVPLLILYLLILCPCGDAFSLDRVLRMRSKLRAAPAVRDSLQYGYSVFLCWSVFAFCYFVAGISKLSVDPFWGQGANLKRITLADSVVLIEYDHNLALKYVPEFIPDLLLTLAASGAVAIEISAILVLFSPVARYFVPLLTVCLQLGIFLGQEFIFFDLLLLPLIFVDPDRVKKALPGWARFRTAVPEHPPPVESKPRNSGDFPRGLRSKALLFALTGTLVISGWLFKVERFPLLSAWGMYALDYTHPWFSHGVSYSKIFVVKGSGERSQTDLDEYVDFLGHARWMDVTTLPHGHPRWNQLFDAIASHYNRGQLGPHQIQRFEVEWWYWNFKPSPDERNFGTLGNLMTVEVE